MTNSRLLLVQCITLLVLEHKEGVATSSSSLLINSVLDLLPKSEAIDMGTGISVQRDLETLLVGLLRTNEENFPNHELIIQELMVICKDHSYLYESLSTIFNEKLSVDKAVMLIQDYRQRLSIFVNDEKITKIMKDYYTKIAFKRESVNSINDLVQEMGTALIPYLSASDRIHNTGKISGINFSDLENIESSFTAVKEVLESNGTFRSGWQSLNRMLGSLQAFKSGEFVLVGGLKHNFKSGFMLSLFTHFALFNKPFLKDKSKSPLLVFLSFENETNDNLLWIYEYLKENDYGIKVDRETIDPKEASAYIASRLMETGFELRMERFDPSEFTVASLISYLDSLINQGYEIKALFIDYLNMLPKTGLQGSVNGDDIRLLFRRVRNYTSAKGITCITPHQLSTDALNKAMDGVGDFAKTIAKGAYYDGCRRLAQDPDLELIIHIEIVDMKYYLTIARGKHRNENHTPIKDQYIVLPFREIGTVPWDIDSEDTAIASPSGGEQGTGNELPWWER